MNTRKFEIVVILFVSRLSGVLPILVISELLGNVTLDTPNFAQNNSFSIYAPIKLVDIVECQVTRNTSDLRGAIWVFLGYDAGGCRNTDWSSYGAVGVIFPSPDRPVGYNYIYIQNYFVYFPRAQISFGDIALLQELLSNDPNLKGLFASGDPNEWKEMNQSILALTLYAITIACSLAASILSLLKLGRIISVNGLQRSIAQVSLILISIGSLDLAAVFIYVIVRNLLNLVGYLEVFALFLVFADACQTLACLAICVFWYDIMTDVRGVPKKKISKRIAVPLIVAAVIIVILLLLLPFNILVPSARIIKVLVPVVYFVVALAITISWLILGSKLLKSLKSKAAVSDNKRKIIKKLSDKIFITTALFFSTRIIEVAWTVCELIYIPLSAVITLSLAGIFNVATNAMLSQVFSVPKNSDKEATDGVKLTEQKKPLSES